MSNETHAVNQLYIVYPGDSSVGQQEIGATWQLPDQADLTASEAQQMCQEVQDVLAKWLGDDVRVTCDVLQRMEAEAEQRYADDLAELDRIINDPEYQPHTEEIDLEDYRESDFQYDAHRERSLFHH